jgi:hypothetical protein
LFGWLIASHILIYGLFVVWWHGDAAWGPRYLLPILPFIVLPAGALLSWTGGLGRRWAWGTFAVLVPLGVAVNLGGVLVDQRVSFVYLLQTAAAGNLQRMEDQRWSPELSPVLVHWNEATKRISKLAELLSQPVSLVSGTYAKELVDPVDAEAVPQSDLFPRWMSGSAVFEVRNHGQPVELWLEYVDNRPESLGPAVVQILVNGSAHKTTITQSKEPLPDKRLPWFVEARLDDVVVDHDSVTIEIRTQTWHAPRDIRDLGVQIWDLHLRSNGQEMAMSESPFWPMPVSDERPWSFELETWFYVPLWHLADVWPWYLYLSDLPRWLMLIALLPAAGLLWSGSHLWRILRRPS